MDGTVKGRSFRVIIRIRVEYEQHFIYGRADRKVNDGITFEQSHFSKIHETTKVLLSMVPILVVYQVYMADISTRAVRALTDRQTYYSNSLAHAQRVKYGIHSSRGVHAEELGLPTKSLLVMDSFSAHLTTEVSENLKNNNAQSVIVPGGCTSKVQPLDVNINKQILKNKWSHYVKSKVDVLTSLTATSKTKIPTASKEELVDRVTTAWKTLSQQTDLIKKSFSATGITAAGDRVKGDAVLKAAYDKVVQQLAADEHSDEDPFAELSDGDDSDSH